MNSFQDLNNLSNTAVTFNQESSANVVYGTFLGNTSITVDEDSDHVLQDRLDITSTTNLVRDVLVNVTIPIIDNNFPVSSVTYSGPYSNVWVQRITDQQWQIRGIRDSIRFEEVFANTRVQLAADYASAFSYNTTVIDQIGQTYPWTTNVTVNAQAEWSQASTMNLSYGDRNTLYLAGDLANSIYIIDAVPDAQYRVTLTDINGPLDTDRVQVSSGNTFTLDYVTDTGNLLFEFTDQYGNTTVGNVITFTGNRTTVNDIFGAGGNFSTTPAVRALLSPVISSDDSPDFDYTPQFQVKIDRLTDDVVLANAAVNVAVTYQEFFAEKTPRLAIAGGPTVQIGELTDIANNFRSQSYANLAPRRYNLTMANLQTGGDGNVSFGFASQGSDDIWGGTYDGTATIDASNTFSNASSVTITNATYSQMQALLGNVGPVIVDAISEYPEPVPDGSSVTFEYDIVDANFANLLVTTPGALHTRQSATGVLMSANVRVCNLQPGYTDLSSAGRAQFTYGNVFVSNAQSTIGTHSVDSDHAFFTGIPLAATIDRNGVNTGNCQIEGFFYPTEMSDRYVLFDTGPNTENIGIPGKGKVFNLYANGAVAHYQRVGSDPFGYTLINLSNAGVVTANSWHHWAYSRASTGGVGFVDRMWINGNLVTDSSNASIGQFTSGSGTAFDSVYGTPRIGALQTSANATAGNAFVGYIGPIRVQNSNTTGGDAVYNTDPISVPTVAFSGNIGTGNLVQYFNIEPGELTSGTPMTLTINNPDSTWLDEYGPVSYHVTIQPGQGGPNNENRFSVTAVTSGNAVVTNETVANVANARCIIQGQASEIQGFVLEKDPFDIFDGTETGNVEVDFQQRIIYPQGAETGNRIQIDYTGSNNMIFTSNY